MADLAGLQALADTWTMPTYARLPVAFSRGQGTRLWDVEGREYLDFLSAISVCNVGHCHPRVVGAVRDQVGVLIQTSNLALTEPALRLAERLARGSLGGKVFFSNSGAEANECAVKLARKRAFLRTGEAAASGRIVVASGGFHGRTMGALSATPQSVKRAPFEPLLAGFVSVERNDARALEEACDERTVAVLLEPVQGEGGVHVLEDEFLAAARAACDRNEALLIFDEVQCGLGRTGTLWAYQQTGVRPDVVTSAKSLAAGLPMGATITTPEVADTFEPGDHGSTFGGGPVVAAAALAVLDVLEEEGLLARVRELGARFRAGLEGLVKAGGVVEVRGRGLMLALDMAEDGAPARVVATALEEGIVLNAPGPRTLRFLPPLVVDEQEVDRVLEFLDRVI